MARGAQAGRNLAWVAGTASALAVALALLALILAIVSWPRETQWVRVSVLCLAVGGAALVACDGLGKQDTGEQAAAAARVAA